MLIFIPHSFTNVMTVLPKWAPFFELQQTYLFKTRKSSCCERKRHTARRVVSTPSVVLTGNPTPVLTWPGGGYPARGYPGRVPPSRVPPGRVPPPSWPQGGYQVGYLPSRVPFSRVPPILAPGGYPCRVPPSRVPPRPGTHPAGYPPWLDLAGYPPVPLGVCPMAFSG